jgi:hypothetical protein
VAAGLGNVVRAEAADGVQRQADALAQGGKTRPADAGDRGMRRRGTQ